jgi:hypothetical protein
VIARPVLRRHELAYLGRSGAPRDRQLSLSDLLVSVQGERIVLRSKSLGREVVPRLTTAHNTEMRTVGAYRFLAALQVQGITPRAPLGLGHLEPAAVPAARALWPDRARTA